MAAFKLLSLTETFEVAATIVDWNDYVSSEELFLTTETETSEIKRQQEHDYYMVSRSHGSQSDHAFRHARCQVRGFNLSIRFIHSEKPTIEF